MTTSAQTYWRNYHDREFIHGMGTEHVLQALTEIPAADTWADIGSGSESLMWACALDVHTLAAADSDGDRLRLLEQNRSLADPPRTYQMAMHMAGRSADHWSAVRTMNVETAVVDCLSGKPPFQRSFDLVTQFGLLGLCRDRRHFDACFDALARMVRPGGWFVGANWQAADLTGRVVPSRELYTTAIERTGMQCFRAARIVSTDPDYPAVWLSVAKRPSRRKKGD